MKFAPPKKSEEPATLNFDCSIQDMQLIGQIMQRAMEYHKDHTSLNADHMLVAVDITALHCNGTPLKLLQFLMCDKTDFIAEFTGIQKHIDRATGQLRGEWRPMFAEVKQ